MDEQSLPPLRVPDEDHIRRYDQVIDLDSGSTHARVVDLVGRDGRVLELGPATGYMTEAFVNQGCSVVAIELDPRMAPQAERFAERVIVGNLDEMEIEHELGDDRFDVIVAADVLEHLRDPLATLRRLRPFLKPDGHVVVSLPNIAHGSVRLALLEGQFDYRETGLLDRTHLHFFTRKSIDELFDESEFAITDVYRQALAVDASEVTFDPAEISAEVRELLARDPEAETYQFVVRAIPMAADGLREMQRRMREMATESADLRDQLTQLRLVADNGRAQIEELRAANEQAWAVASQVARLRGELIVSHDELLRRDEEIEVLQDDLRDLRGQLAASQTQELRLRVRLNRIHSSPPFKAYDAIGALPGIRGLKGARSAGYLAAVRSAQPPNG